MSEIFGRHLGGGELQSIGNSSADVSVVNGDNRV